MLRLLGILSLGHLVFGGRRHHLGRGLLLGALLGYLANRKFDADRVAEDVHKAARNAKRTARKVERAAREAERTAREAVRAAKREIRKEEHERKLAEIHERIEERRAEREEYLKAVRSQTEARETVKKEEEVKKEIRALPVSGINEAKEIRDLTEDLERDARTAAMAADVPTIDFPEEEEEKYYSSRKYGYVQ